MSAIDNEFVTFGISGLAKEFEELYPDYQFGGDGMCRTQCELPCGLIVTEMSLNNKYDHVRIIGQSNLYWNQDKEITLLLVPFNFASK